MKSILARLSEGSTWAAVSVLLMFFGIPAPVVQLLNALVHVGPDVIDALATLGVLGAAGAAIALPDKGAQPPAPVESRAFEPQGD